MHPGLKGRRAQSEPPPGLTGATDGPGSSFHRTLQTEQATPDSSLQETSASISYSDADTSPHSTNSSEDRQHAESSSQLADCCICLSPMITDLEALPCAHVFHERCFRKALRSKQRCPLCQLDVASASSADVSGLQALQAQHLQGRILRTLAPNGSLRGVLEPLDRHIQTVPAHVPASADHVHASADHVHANADHDHISHNAVHGFVCMGLLCVMFYVVLAVVSTHTPQLIPDLPGSVLQFLKLTLRFGFAGSIMVLSAIYVMLVIPY